MTFGSGVEFHLFPRVSTAPDSNFNYVQCDNLSNHHPVDRNRWNSCFSSIDIVLLYFSGDSSVVELFPRMYGIWWNISVQFCYRPKSLAIWDKRQSKNRNSSASIPTGCCLAYRGNRVQFPVGQMVPFFPSQHPGRFRGPPGILSSGYRGIFPHG